MKIAPGSRWRSRASVLAIAGVSVAWMYAILTGSGSELTAQLTSNIGLCLAALLAGAAGIARGRTDAGAIRRFWVLLGAASLSWGLGQAVWTWYESVLGREVPFPSVADAGYLGLPAFAVAALLSLPLAAPTLAGRLRTILDGLMVASSLLLVSWIVVLGPVFHSGGDGLLVQAISLAYPASDVVVITLVIYTWLRTRHLNARLPIPLPLVGVGLVAFAVSDSGFAYLTTTGQYGSGSVIDMGWFLGFVLLLLAAVWPSRQHEGTLDAHGSRSLGNLLPYAAVTVALLTSALEIWRTGQAETFVSWTRTALMVLLVVRQVLTLMENHSLTKNLEQRVAERTAELRGSQQRFAALVQHSSDVVTVVDRQGTVSYQSESSLRVLGYDATDMVGRSLCDLMNADRAADFLEALEQASTERLRVHTIHTVWRHAAGRECQMEITITNLLDTPDVAGLVLNSRDVTDRTVLEDQLIHQAFTDSLTGLANRALFKDRLQHALTARDTAQRTIAVLFLDLDGFKAVNDTLGHSAGDDLLVQVAERLSAEVRPRDTVARFGGDEFAVLVEAMPGTMYETGLAERINTALRAPFRVCDEQVHVAASVGIAQLDDNAPDAEQLLRNADLAMYQAKAKRAGGYSVYSPDMHSGLVDRVRLQGDLHHAAENDELVLHYQPLISMRTGRITGVEALMRWNHPERGLVPPAEFIPLAETTGIIHEIGLWAIREACRQTLQWHRNGPADAGPLGVSVNLSGRQLQAESLTRQIEDILLETGLPASCLTLEMTESVLIENAEETLATLAALRAMGVRLAIDDFGTGYSSLSYLHKFPVDVLKIDRSFVERLSQGSDVELVSTIIRLGQTMHLEIVAEGIERSSEMLMLRRQGCTTGQGYHFSPPLPAHELEALLTEQVRLAGPVSGPVGGAASGQTA